MRRKKSALIRAMGPGFLALALLIMMGCGETEPPPANSDGGHLYVDLEEAVAAGWNSEVVIFGPVQGGRRCHGGECYYDHRRLEILEVFSSDEDVVEVLEIQEESFLGVPGIRLLLEAKEEGEAKIELVFDVEGLEPGEEGDQSELDQEEAEALDEEHFRDSFTVEVREVAEIRLRRVLDHVDPAGPYGSCGEGGAGIYLTAFPGEYDLLLEASKLDARGERLRGSGALPFEVEPEGAMEVVEEFESLHLFRVRPKEHGKVTLKPREGAGADLVQEFLAPAEVAQIDVRGYELSQEGGRLREVTQFREGFYYEIAATPRLEGGPLCGGRLEQEAISLTPALCEPAGSLGRGTDAFLAHFAGECILRVAVEGVGGGAGITQDLAIPVVHGY